MHLILKLSKLCNLRCTYCYEYDELGDAARMPLDGLDHLFRTAAAHLAARGEPAGVVLHGGEPSLLPASYLRGVVASARSRFGAEGVPLRISLQTNLTRPVGPLLELMDELDVALGVSLDVIGDERRMLGGGDSRDRVLANLQRLFDAGAIRRRRVGAISVLHAGNVDHVLDIFDFYERLGLGYRILPVFSVLDAPARSRHLMLTHEQVVDAYTAVARRMLAGSRIRVFPVWNHICAAVWSLAGLPGRPYEPGPDEWALIVNTNGDAYTHADAYSPRGLLGNVFTTPVPDLMASPARARTVADRARRAAVCAACDHGRTCSRIPLVEALPSERAGDDDAPRCAIARPVIDRIKAGLSASPAASAGIERIVAEAAGARQ